MGLRRRRRLGFKYQRDSFLTRRVYITAAGLGWAGLPWSEAREVPGRQRPSSLGCKYSPLTSRSKSHFFLYRRTQKQLPRGDNPRRNQCGGRGGGGLGHFVSAALLGRRPHAWLARRGLLTSRGDLDLDPDQEVVRSHLGARLPNYRM